MTFKPLYIYLQRPDSWEWVTVGRYLYDKDKAEGSFQYAPSYFRAGHAWCIDPINLPLLPEIIHHTSRYRGLHDVLRDAGPDGWGKLLIQKEKELSDKSPEYLYLLHSDNAHRWGALAMGLNKTPNVTHISTPRLPDLEALTNELLAISERRPPANAKLRRRLVGTPSAGGARPKATIKDGNDWWLVKPMLSSDIVDIPLLEHAIQRWGNIVGLRFAHTVIHRITEGQSVVRVLRFDRQGDRRFMAMSGASLLQTEYPAVHANEHSKWSYPRLAEEMRRIGVAEEDLRELFGRMIFNALVGNDDDHPRNHAVIYDHAKQRWILAPAFDVVPHPEETPKQLCMQVATGQWGISRMNLLANHIRFGFASRQEAERYMDELIGRMEVTFEEMASVLTVELADFMRTRFKETRALVRADSM